MTRFALAVVTLSALAAALPAGTPCGVVSTAPVVSVPATHYGTGPGYGHGHKVALIPTPVAVFQYMPALAPAPQPVAAPAPAAAQIDAIVAQRLDALLGQRQQRPGVSVAGDDFFPVPAGVPPSPRPPADQPAGLATAEQAWAVLSRRCASCHTGDSASGGFAMFAGAGQRAVLGGAEWRRIAAAAGGGSMPPAAAADPTKAVPAAEVSVLEAMAAR